MLQRPVLDELDLPPVDEIKKAIKQISSGKSSGKDGISAESFKVAGPDMMAVFYAIFLCIWNEEKMPNDLRDSTIEACSKTKGSKATTEISHFYS
ncbi:hypothetical protein scyTo_0015099 [Scyliorhinus torazame]|uniref:Reverse transcriptase domain-containing protein n=1 Tax=Scyliorhinus torazame TaxID=75743 RepID=A0A401P2A8_SCYTO|nr:hypothetical protein [Scyliorhinus torazame]